MKIFSGIVIVLSTATVYSQQTIEKYDIFELTLKAPVTGNPFREVQFKAVFKHVDDKIEVTGFIYFIWVQDNRLKEK